jgi:hypothetical protein
VEKEKFKYFMSYVVNNSEYYNTEIVRDNFIESIDDIRYLQDYIADQIMLNKELKITIINYRIF